MLREFFSWWGRQLLETLPAGVRRSRPAHEAGDALLLTLLEPPMEPPALEAVRRRQRRLVPLGRFPADPAGLARLRATVGAAGRGTVQLLLPPRLLLEQEITMPLAAERGLDAALRWEMDRLTPFAAEAVFWSWLITRRDRLRGRLLIQLRLVPRSAVEALLAALAASGLAPAVLASAADPARAVPLNRPRRGWGMRGAVFAGAALGAALLAAAVAAPFVQQGRELRRVNDAIAAARPEVDAAEALRRRLLERAASADVIAAEAIRVGDTLRTLAAVTDVLPDNTYLFGLTLRDRTLTITGQSASAAKLIPAMAADPMFKNPVFAAPITRNEMTAAEAFSIRAEVNP